jgi:hypothetical protein
LEIKSTPVVAEAPPAAPAAKTASKIALMPGDEIIEMDRMRKLIADQHGDEQTYCTAPLLLL